MSKVYVDCIVCGEEIKDEQCFCYDPRDWKNQCVCESCRQKIEARVNAFDTVAGDIVHDLFFDKMIETPWIREEIA